MLRRFYEYAGQRGNGGESLRPYFATALGASASHSDLDAGGAAVGDSARGELWSDAAAQAVSDDGPAFFHLRSSNDDTIAILLAQESGTGEALEDLCTRRAEGNADAIPLSKADAAVHLECRAKHVATLTEAQWDVRTQLLQARLGK